MANPISRETTIGTMGELLVQLRLLQYGVQALKDSGNDLVALRGYAVRCVQVKTSTGDIPAWPDERKLYHILAVVHHHFIAPARQVRWPRRLARRSSLAMT